MPLFVDTYGTTKNKSAWMAVALLSTPLGVIFGYTLTYTIMVYSSWQFSFYIQGWIVIIFALLFSFVPNKYTEIDQIQILLKAEKKRRQNLPEIGGTGNIRRPTE